MNVSYRHVPRQDQKQAGVFAANCENCGHFFKYRAVAPFKTSVTFTVNGVSYTGTVCTKNKHCGFSLFVCFVALRPNQQLWSWRDGLFIQPHLFSWRA